MGRPDFDLYVWLLKSFLFSCMFERNAHVWLGFRKVRLSLWFWNLFLLYTRPLPHSASREQQRFRTNLRRVSMMRWDLKKLPCISSLSLEEKTASSAIKSSKNLSMLTGSLSLRNSVLSPSLLVGRKTISLISSSWSSFPDAGCSAWASFDFSSDLGTTLTLPVAAAADSSVTLLELERMVAIIQN